MKKIFSLICLLLIFTCIKDKQQVDTIITNAKVYTVNPNFETAEAFAIKDGKFVAVGNTKTILNKFIADTIMDAKGQTIVPGFIDAHCHFYALGLFEQTVSLVGTTSFVDVVKRVTDF